LRDQLSGFILLEKFKKKNKKKGLVTSIITFNLTRKEYTIKTMKYDFMHMMNIFMCAFKTNKSSPY